ncbi:MAG TPA: hypothetical protein VKB50_05560 [Vicinamibacterales bacterium]|nr:hypothetical protein [Vicinamibacterales bacterium]
MNKPPTMDESIRTAAYDLFRQAKESLQTQDFASAERCCMEGWGLIPEPKYGWDSSYMCLLYVVRFLRGARCYDLAMKLVHEYLLSGYHHDYVYGPYFWLGTLHFEKGEMAEAFGQFDRANKMSAGRCFKEEDPRYKSFYKAFKTRGRPKIN